MYHYEWCDVSLCVVYTNLAGHPCRSHALLTVLSVKDTQVVEVIVLVMWMPSSACAFNIDVGWPLLPAVEHGDRSSPQ